MASSPIVRCTFCGSTVSMEATVCPTCGNEIHAQKRFPINSGALALLIGVLSLALLVGGSGEESGIRRTLQSMANRLDQLATDLDPRLAATPPATEQEVAILLPTPSDINSSTVGNTDEDEDHNAGINDPALSLPSGEAGVDISTSQTTSVSAVIASDLVPETLPSPTLEAPTETSTQVPTEVPTETSTETPLATFTPIPSPTLSPSPTSSPSATFTPLPSPTQLAPATATDTIPTLQPTPTLIAPEPTVSLVASATNLLSQTRLITYTTQPSDEITSSITGSDVNGSEVVSDSVANETLLQLLAPTPTPTVVQVQVAEATATTQPTPEPLVYVVKSGDTLIAIAARHQVTLDELLLANGFSSGRASVLLPGQSLIIPNQQVEIVLVQETEAQEVALAPTATIAVPTATAIPPTDIPPTVIPATATPVTAAVPDSDLTYVVKAGDTPTTIARRFGISVTQLLAINGLTLNDATRIRIGQTLIVAVNQAPIDAQQSTITTPAPVQTYVVKAGDTPTTIARRFGVSVTQLLASNGLTINDATRIRIGQTLIIPGGQAVVETQQSATDTPVPVQTYTVQSGDTPLAIANRYGISVDTLLSFNGLSRADATQLRPGQKLLIPGSGVAPPQATATDLPSGPTATAAQPGAEQQNESKPAIRLDAPRLRSPENGTSVSCGGNNSLVWEPVPFITNTDRYLVHLGYVSGRDSNGTAIVTWLLTQDRPFSDPQWHMDNNLCAYSIAEFNRQWRWYVEVIDPNAGNRIVSAPGEIFSFRWE